MAHEPYVPTHDYMLLVLRDILAALRDVDDADLTEMERSIRNRIAYVLASPEEAARVSG